MASKQSYTTGSLSVGGNLAAGGELKVSGSTTIGHNLKVEGWLDAKNIKGPNKGVFTTEDNLKKAYPNPENGWFAGVGTSIPCDLYVAMNGEWVHPANGTMVLQIDTEELQRLNDNVNTLTSIVAGFDENALFIREEAALSPSSGTNTTVVNNGTVQNGTTTTGQLTL